MRPNSQEAMELFCDAWETCETWTDLHDATGLEKEEANAEAVKLRRRGVALRSCRGIRDIDYAALQKRVELRAYSVKTEEPEDECSAEDLARGFGPDETPPHARDARPEVSGSTVDAG